MLNYCLLTQTVLIMKFKDVLFNEKIIRHKMKRIQNKKHKLGTYEIDKISLSYFEIKCVI